MALEQALHYGRRSKRRPDGPIRFRTNFRNTIYDVMRARGWVETEDETHFDFLWAEREWVYADIDSLHLEPWQRVNHFRNGKELCRKDNLSKNVKRVRRQFERDGNAEMAARYDFAPTTLVRPGDYAHFVEEFKKPANASGIGGGGGGANGAAGGGTDGSRKIGRGAAEGGAAGGGATERTEGDNCLGALSRERRASERGAFLT